ncbi:MAG: hypothetical protein ACT4OZ_07995 [Gemmatimonadota bacterium]
MISRAILIAVLAIPLLATTSRSQRAPSPPCQAVDVIDDPVPHRGRSLRPCPGVEVALRNRVFVIPPHVVDGLPIQPAVLVRWSPYRWLSLAVDNQTVDNGGPGHQGRFRAQRTVGPGGGSGNFLQETTLELEVRLGRGTSQWRFAGTASRGVRSYYAQDTVSGAVVSGNRRELVPTLEITFDRYLGDSHRSAVSLGVAGAFLPSDHALYLRTLPPDTTTFGTVLALRGAAAFAVAGRVTAGVDAVLPLSGRNSVNRTTGLPVRIPLLSASLTARLSRDVDATLLVSNALGETGALSFVADREYPAIGTGVSFRPRRGRRERSTDVAMRPLSVIGLAPSGNSGAEVTLSRGSIGTFGSATLSPADGLRFAAFLDHLSGVVDEGELGAAISVRLLGSPAGGGRSLGFTASASRSNNLMVNLLAGHGGEFTRRGLTRSGYAFGDEDVAEGKLYILSAALPLSIAVGDAGSFWVAPVTSLVQRRGVQAAGITAGIGGHLGPSWSLISEVAVDLSGRGNALTDSARISRVPWTLALFRRLNASNDSRIDIYGQLGTRVGNSPFHTLRARGSALPVLAIGVRARSG